MKKIGHSSWLMITLFFFLLVSVIDQSSASNYEIREELRFIHQEIGLLREENHHQNMEIALLKQKIGITKDDDQRMVTTSPDDNHRNKRPVRLLPPHLLYGERKNETEQQKQMNRRRYEQPTNCSDLSLLGYTLNGFYTVKSNETSTKRKSTNDDIKLETVFCAFKQPEGTFNPSLVEKRIISRRETKASSGKVLCFHATRTTDLEVNNHGIRILFEKVNVNLGNAFNGATGTFTVAKSGVYLLIFRGVAIFPIEKPGRQFWVHFTKNGIDVAKTSVYGDKKNAVTELDKLIKGKRGDTFTVGVYFYDKPAKVSGNSTSFSAYLLEDQE